MNNITALPATPTAKEPPKRRAIRRRSGAWALIFSVALASSIALAVLLCAAVLLYDGPLLSFGSGGIWIGRAPDPLAGLLPLTAFSSGQRQAGAVAVALLAMPAIFILFHLQRLFRLYAAGAVFTPANARRLKAVGLGLALYAFTPFLANRLVMFAGVTNDPVWFHFDEVMALLLGALLFVVADVMEFGREIERDRDGFV
jgi:hypothetical protein